jgi:Tol biopolymer transport system component
MAQPFNAARLHFEGNPVPIAENIEYYDPRMLGYFSVSGDVLLYRQASIQNRELVWLDATGKELDHWGDPAPYIGGNSSPKSGSAVLFRANADAHGDSLWLADLDRKTVTRLTPDSEMDQHGVVSPDAKTAVITTTSGYHSSLAVRSLVSSGKEEQLTAPNDYFFVANQSTDGRYVFFILQDPKTSFDIYVMDMAGDRKLRPVLNGPYAERDPKLSPDNKWLAFSSDENGAGQFYVTPFPGGGPKWQVSSGDASYGNETGTPLDWSPDSKTLYYRSGEKIYAVEMRTTGDKPEFSAPKELMHIAASVGLISIQADGKRTLATRPVGQPSASPLGLVLNWQHLLQ